jgi:hypothetical protein
VLTAAQHIGAGRMDVPGFTMPKVENLEYGQTVTSTVDRQSAHFYKLTVTEENLRNGVIVTCTSAGSDKFKVITRELHSGLLRLIYLYLLMEYSDSFTFIFFVRSCGFYNSSYTLLGGLLR